MKGRILGCSGPRRGITSPPSWRGLVARSRAADWRWTAGGARVWREDSLCLDEPGGLCAKRAGLDCRKRQQRLRVCRPLQFSGPPAVAPRADIGENVVVGTIGVRTKGRPGERSFTEMAAVLQQSRGAAG